MSETVETVKVKAGNSSGFRVINKSDFDPAKHTEFNQDSESWVVKPEEQAIAVPLVQPEPVAVATPWGGKVKGGRK